MAELVCSAPAERYGPLNKGRINIDFDADLVLVDPNKTWLVDPEDSPSSQGSSPFTGMELTAQVQQTFLRGRLTYKNGNNIGSPQGVYLKRSSTDDQTTLAEGQILRYWPNSQSHH